MIGGAAAIGSGPGRDARCGIRRVRSAAATALLAASLSACAGSGEQSPQGPVAGPVARAVDGVLDLRGWEPETEGPVELGGQWRFVWGELVPPERGCPPDAPLADLPGSWSDGGGTGLPARGYATYCLEVLLDQRDVPLALYVPRMRTAGIAWVDGRRVASVGEVGIDAATSRPRRVDRLTSIVPGPRTEIVLQVSNFHFREGGADKPLVLGAAGDATVLASGRISAMVAAFAGGFAILGLYHVILFAARRENLASLVFGLLCLCVAAYQVTRDNDLFAALFPRVPWTAEIRLEYTLFALSTVLAALFVERVFPRDIPPVLPRLTLASSLVFTLLVWATPVYLSSQWWLLALQVAFLALCIWGLVLIGRALWRGRPGAGWFLVGCTLLTFAVISDGLLLRVLDDPPRVLPFGFLALVLSQAILLAIIQSGERRRINELSDRMLVLAAEKLSLEREAYRDHLTGLENRRRLDLDIERLRRRAGEGIGPEDGMSAADSRVSLVYLDLDRFKEINDHWGHEVGDEVLVGVARRIRETVRSYDLSVRWGGDEFVVLLPDIDAGEAAERAEALRYRLAEPMEIAGHAFEIEASVGVVTVPADQVDLASMLRRADAAMFEDKRTRRVGRRGAGIERGESGEAPLGPGAPGGGGPTGTSGPPA